MRERAIRRAGRSELPNDDSQYRYWAFISYSHQDKSWGDWLHRSLETYRVPKQLVGRKTPNTEPVPARILPVFRDREELPTATNLGEVITKALGESRYLVVICSPRAAKSRWVNEEILAFKRAGRSHRIVAVIVDGEPNADDKPELGVEECFPEALRVEIDADGQVTDRRSEPIAADARLGRDGKRDAKLKIVAGILGVGFDDLKQRELQRRQRRLAVWATFATALLMVVTTLALWAMYSQVQARRAENRSRTQLARVLTAQGVELLAGGDRFGALLLFTHALGEEPHSSPEQNRHRTRIGSILAGTDELIHCRRLEVEEERRDAYLNWHEVTSTAVTGNGRYLLVLNAPSMFASGGMIPQYRLLELWDLAPPDLLWIKRLDEEYDADLRVSTGTDEVEIASQQNRALRIQIPSGAEEVAPPRPATATPRHYATWNHRLFKVWRRRGRPRNVQYLAHPGPVSAFAVDEVRRVLATWSVANSNPDSTDTQITVFDLDRGIPLHEPRTLGANQRVHFSPSSGRVFISSLVRYDPNEEREEKRVPVVRVRKYDPVANELGELLPPTEWPEIISPSGRYFVEVHRPEWWHGPHRFRIFDTEFQRYVSLPFEEGSTFHSIRDVRFSTDERFFVVAYQHSRQQGGGFRVWDLSSRSGITYLEADTIPATIAISDDGARVVIGGMGGLSGDGGTRIWSLLRGEPTATEIAHSNVTLTLFSRDGRQVLTASGEPWRESQAKLRPTSRVWDALSGEPRSRWLDHGDGPVHAACLSRDGSVLFTAAQRRLWVWDVGGSQVLIEPLRHGGEIREVTALNGDQTVVTSCEDGYVRILKLDAAKGESPDLMRLAEFLAERRLDASGAPWLLDATKVSDCWDTLPTPMRSLLR